MRLDRITVSGGHRRQQKRFSLHPEAFHSQELMWQTSKGDEKEWPEEQIKPNKHMPQNLYTKSKGETILSETVMSSNMKTKT